jgi:hypothetical protein
MDVREDLRKVTGYSARFFFFDFPGVLVYWESLKIPAIYRFSSRTFQSSLSALSQDVPEPLSPIPALGFGKLRNPTMSQLRNLIVGGVVLEALPRIQELDSSLPEDTSVPVHVRQ